MSINKNKLSENYKIKASFKGKYKRTFKQSIRKRLAEKHSGIYRHKFSLGFSIQNYMTHAIFTHELRVSFSNTAFRIT